jgi:type 1 glutamine amidotransferase
MKLRVFLRIATLLLALAPLFSTMASANPGRLKVLFLGHDSKHHNSNEYCPIITSALTPEGIDVEYATKVDVLNIENLKRFDAVMLYANHGMISEEQLSALITFVEGGKGFVPVHCASACFGRFPRFVSLVGGRFKSHRSGVFKAAIVQPQHPSMLGLGEFESWDETYVHSDHLTDGRTVLMERIEGNVREPWTWVRNQGSGRVFYTASGHDERTWKEPGFQKLLRNGIVWSVGDERRSGWEEARKSAGK